MMKITIFDWFINHHFYQITKNEYFHVKNSPFGFSGRNDMYTLNLPILSYLSYKGVIADIFYWGLFSQKFSHVFIIYELMITGRHNLTVQA